MPCCRALLLAAGLVRLWERLRRPQADAFLLSSRRPYWATGACCNPSAAVRKMWELGHDWGRPLHAVIGPRCSASAMRTAEIAELRKMLKIADMRGDVMSRFHNALYLGDAGERVKLLAEAGHLPLAYLCAICAGVIGACVPSAGITSATAPP